MTYSDQFFILDKALQTSNLSVNTALQKIQETKEALEQLYSDPEDYGLWLTLLKDEYEQENTFQGVEIVNKEALTFEQLRQKAINFRDILITNMCCKFNLIQDLQSL